VEFDSDVTANPRGVIQFSTFVRRGTTASRWTAWAFDLPNGNKNTNVDSRRALTEGLEKEQCRDGSVEYRVKCIVKSTEDAMRM
jgi:hypothetical protein